MDAERTISEANQRAASGASNSHVPAKLAGKFQVVGVLGEGGTGIVYDAVRKEDHTPVALKVIHAHLAGDRQVRGRFQREAAILRRLEGPHICPVLEVGEVADGSAESLLYMALAKLDGPSLDRVLEAERPIDVDRALDVMLEVCAALRAAHAQGVIHRDLKPANVILEKGRQAVVVDFGMSKIVAGAPSTTNLTAHNMVFGTPEYMSPEQARGDELDARCDVYAAGIMLYEMLTGAPPFTGATPLSVLTEHLTSEIVPPSSRAGAGRVSPALDSVVMHALARDRERRYGSASAFGDAIRHAREAPSDVAAVQPAAIAADSQAAVRPAAIAADSQAAASPPPAAPSHAMDAFAATMPSITRDVPSETLRAFVPPAIAGQSSASAAAPSTSSSSATPTSASSESDMSSSRPAHGSDAARKNNGPSDEIIGSLLPRQNRSNPPGRAKEDPRKPARDRARSELTAAPNDESARTWLIVWIVAAIVSIGIGVYAALR